jgi:hypothetical protein
MLHCERELHSLFESRALANRPEASGEGRNWHGPAESLSLATPSLQYATTELTWDSTMLQNTLVKQTRETMKIFIAQCMRKEHGTECKNRLEPDCGQARRHAPRVRAMKA